MKPDLLLHIGLPKTGSTSIQHVLGARRDALLEMGVLYPKSPGDTNHALLPASLLDEKLVPRLFFPTLWEGMTPSARLQRFRSEFREELATMPSHVRQVIISAEHCGILLGTDEAVQGVAEMVRPFVGRVRVLAYLRRQDLYEASIYNERLRVGEVGAPTLPQGDANALRDYNYETVLGRWARVFGEEAIVARIFDRAALVRGDVVDDFLEVAGLDIDVPEEDAARKSNTSLGSEGQKLMILIGNRLVEKSGREALETQTWRRIGNLLSTVLPGKGWRPTREESREFLARFAASNEAVRRRFRPDLPALFADGSDDLPEHPEDIPAETLVTALIDALVHEIETDSRHRATDWLQIGRLQKQLGNAAEAKSALRQAIWRNPNLIAARMTLADEHIREGDLDFAREQVAAVLKIAPKHQGALNMLARLDRPAGKPPPRPPVAVRAAEGARSA